MRERAAERVRENETARLKRIADMEREREANDAKKAQESTSHERVAEPSAVVPMAETATPEESAVAYATASMFHSADAMLAREIGRCSVQPFDQHSASYVHVFHAPAAPANPMPPQCPPVSGYASTAEFVAISDTTLLDPGVVFADKAMLLDGVLYSSNVIGENGVEVKAKVIARFYGARIEHEYKCLNTLFMNASGFFVRPYTFLHSTQLKVASGPFLFSDHVGLVMEKGIKTLEEHVQQNPKISYAEKIFILSRIIDVVEQAHLNRLIIMDLKSSNFMKFRVGDDAVWKGIDMDGALSAGQPLQGNSFKSTAAIMPPELATDYSRLVSTPSIDIWALGMLAYRLFSGPGGANFWSIQGIYDDAGILSALPTLSQETVYRLVAKEYHGEQNSQLRHFLMHVLQVNGADRPSISALKQYPLLSGGASVSASMIFCQLTSIDKKLDRIYITLDSIGSEFRAYNSDMRQLVAGIYQSVHHGNSDNRALIESIIEGNKQTVLKLSELQKNQTLCHGTVHEAINSLGSSICLCLTRCEENLCAQSQSDAKNKVMTELLIRQLHAQEQRFNQQISSVQKSVTDNAETQTEVTTELLVKIAGEITSQLNCVTKDVSEILAKSDKLLDAQLAVHTSVCQLQTHVLNNSELITESKTVLLKLNSFLKDSWQKFNSRSADFETHQGEYALEFQCDIENAARVCDQLNVPSVAIALQEYKKATLEYSDNGIISSSDFKCMVASVRQIQENMAELIGDMKEIKYEIKEIKNAVGAHTEMLSAIICGQFNVPALPFVTPYRPISTLDRFHPKRLFQDEMRLFFICPITMQVAPSGIMSAAGYKIVRPKAWLVKIAPALVICSSIIKAALTVYGIPLPLPPFGDSMTKLSFLDGMTAGLVSSVLTDDAISDAQKDMLSTVLDTVESIDPESPYEDLIEAGRTVSAATTLAYTELRRMLAELEGEKGPIPDDWYVVGRKFQ